MSCFLPEQWSLMHPWLTQVSIEWYFCFEVCQDIRDLFNLTTSHMSTYMVVGTLFLGFSVSFMWSGIQSFPENPPWLKLLWVNCFISAMCYGFLVPGLNGWCGWCIGLFGCCLYKLDLQWNSTVARFADCNRTYISDDVIINIIPPNKFLYFRWRMPPFWTPADFLVVFRTPCFMLWQGFFDEHHLWSTKQIQDCSSPSSPSSPHDCHFEVKGLGLFFSPYGYPIFGPCHLSTLEAVWLAMHGAIAAQSASVQLLTRAIRPPYPSASELRSVKHELAHYESSGGDGSEPPR